MVLVGEDADVVALIVEGVGARLEEEGDGDAEKEGDRHSKDGKRKHGRL